MWKVLKTIDFCDSINSRYAVKSAYMVTDDKIIMEDYDEQS